MRSWRRLHGSELIAQVEPIGGFGTWRVSVWHTENPDEATRHPRDFELLTEAQAAADLLLTQTFKHQCFAGHCGHWLARAG
jgi:hypothetical protein